MLTFIFLMLCFGSGAVGWGASTAVGNIKHARKKRRLLEIHQFSNGLVLPAVDDPSWKIVDEQCRTHGCIRKLSVIGAIRCCVDCGVYVDKMDLEDSWPDDAIQLREYAKAVRRAALERTIEEELDRTRYPLLEAAE